MSAYVSADLRRLVAERADNRCEYCRIPQSETYVVHEVDHIYAEKHGGKTDEANLCFSCWICNRLKGTDLCSIDPLTEAIASFYHPRRDSWPAHFRLDGAVIVPLTAQGRVTARLLQLNRPQRVSERQLLIELGDYP